MFTRISRIAITAIGFCGGLLLCVYLYSIAEAHHNFGMSFIGNVWFQYAAAIFIVLLCSFLAYILSKPITNQIMKMASKIDSWQSGKSIYDLYVICIALLLGLLIAYLLGNLTGMIPLKMISLCVSVATYLVCPYICIRIMWKRRNDLSFFKRVSANKDDGKKHSKTGLKLLDSSAIIDGRICDICKAGFIEGTIIVPHFVVDELRRLSCNEDSLKRNRGRRGLDLLKQMQEHNNTPIELSNTDYDDIQDVDLKLMRLALETGAGIITTDYNLNKTAAVHKVKVLNINELTNAVKTVLLPGEEISVSVIKEGKEQDQGLAYLDDGTMIVIENGKQALGRKCTVVVTSVIQTAAGRMIFAKYE